MVSLPSWGDATEWSSPPWPSARARSLSADELADVLWHDEPPASWAKVIQGCVVRLRKVLGPGSIETLPSGYRLSLAHDQIDAQRFERATERARALLNGSGDADRAAFVIADALSLWRGQALGDVEDWAPARIEAGRLDELHREAEELYVEATLRTGHSEKVLGSCPDIDARAAAARTALGAARSGAVPGRTAERGAEHLAPGPEGVQPRPRRRPGPGARQLEQAMLRQDPALIEHAPLPEPSAACPYRGLLPYDTDDADTFFGRADDVDACLRQLSATGGARRGRTLRDPASRRWSERAWWPRCGGTGATSSSSHPAGTRSTRSPLLPRRSGTTTVVVDQCEEVYSLCQDLTERARFLDDLVEHATTGSLVVVLRADHLVDVSSHPASPASSSAAFT